MIKSTYTTSDGSVFTNFFCAFNAEAMRLGRDAIRMYDEEDNEVFNSEEADGFIFKGEIARALVENFVDHFYGDKHDDQDVKDAGFIFAPDGWRDEWFYLTDKDVLSGDYEFRYDADHAIFKEKFFN